jgi:murein L,D-transpeptidase YafK
MTDANMKAHKNSSYYSFWSQLQPGYAYFEKHHQPPNVVVSDGKYEVLQPLSNTPLSSQLAFAPVK